MNLITKLGLGILSLGLVANIAGNRLLEHYSNQREVAVKVLGNAIQTNFREIGLDEALNNFEKCEGNRDYANGARNLSYIIMPLGGALALGGFGRKKIGVNIYIE